MFGARPDSPAEPASSCSKERLGPSQLRDCDRTGYHFHVLVGSSSNHGVHPYGGSPEAKASCHPHSLDEPSVPCLRGDPARPSVLRSQSAPSCPLSRAKPWPCPCHCPGEGGRGTSAHLPARPDMHPNGCPQEGSSGFSLVSLPGLVLIVSGGLALALVSLQGYLSTCISTM